MKIKTLNIKTHSQLHNILKLQLIHKYKIKKIT